MATTTLTGTTGNDILNAPGSVTTLVAGYQGNDSITLVLGTDEAQAGAGDDSIALNGTGTAAQTINAGSGADTVTVATSHSTFAGTLNLNAGNDTYSNAVQIVGGSVGGNAGNDTITFTGGAVNAFVGGGANDDSITVSAGTTTTSTLIGGGGKDTLNLAGSTFSLSTIQSADGHDIVLASNTTLTNSVVATGAGLDSILLGTSSSATVAAGSGNDTISYGGALAGGVIYGDGIGVSNAGGNDIIGTSAATFGNTAAFSISGGGGADTIDFASGSTGANFIINGGDGNDLIGNSAALLGYSATTIAGGANNDTISLLNVSNAVFIGGGNGADSIFLASGNNTASINGGAGHDTVTLGTSDGATKAGTVSINGGTGTDKVIMFASTAGAVALTTGMADKISAGTFTAYQANVVYGAGDIIDLAVGLSVSAANFAGAGGQIYIATQGGGLIGLSGENSAFAVGSVTVYEDSNDTYFFVNSASASLTYQFVVEGADLITTTSTGNVNATSANFGFTLASVSGTAGVAGSDGVSINLI